MSRSKSRYRNQQLVFLSQFHRLKVLIVPAEPEQGLPAVTMATVIEYEKAPGTVHTFALGNEIRIAIREDQVNRV